VNGERAAQVRAAIEDLARSEGVSPPSIGHVCRTCLQLIGAAAVCTSVRDGEGLYEPVCAVGQVGASLAELQVMVGEGPGMDTVAGDLPVLMTSLEAVNAQRRWPLFTPAAAEMGMREVFAFPLLIGAIAVGSLEVYWMRRPAGKATALSDGLLFSDAALETLLTALLPHNARARFASADQAGLRRGPCLDRWPEVHQATGMVSAQLDVGLAESFALLRAYAFGNDRSLREVAHEVVERRLKVSPEGDAS